jgi:gamma-glutamylcyclotransferase (GGCT)/AIG2-like uncharacterized protein YtfP
MLDLLFVYGTLMRGHANPMSKLLSERADYLGPARCQGRIYRIAHYPGLLLSDDSADIVHGELFRMPDPVALLPVLDDYEQCGPDFPEPTGYLRRPLPVTLDDGSVVEAWTYIFNRRVKESTRIASGRFEVE